MKFKNLIGKDLASNHYVTGNYGDNANPQMPIYLEIDPEDKTVDVFTANFKLNGVPSDIWNNRRLAIQLPFNIDASRLSDFIEEEIASDIDDIIENFSLHYNGSNYTGYYINGDLGYVLVCLEHKIERLAPIDDEIALVRPIEYFDPNIYRSDIMVKIEGIDMVITSETTDEQLEVIAKQLEDEVFEPITFDGTILDMLTELRDDCEISEALREEESSNENEI